MEDRIGKLVKIFYEPFNKGTKARWFCKCDCGNSLFIFDRTLKKGNTISCGCTKPNRKKHISKHGLTNSTTYQSWKNMKSRCNNHKLKEYVNYGGRGITYDPRWESFENFYEDMGSKPDSDFMLDRIDVYGNYTPENCRWVDRSVSNYNRRKLDKNVSGRTGVYWHGASMMWVVECQRGRESRVVKYFNSFEEAVNFRKQLEFDMYEEFKPEDREAQ